MKFIVSSTLLLRHLQSIGGALSSGTQLPILENFLFKIGKNEITISASDLETTMTTSLEVTSKEEGVIAIPAKILLDTLKTFADQPLTFTINEKTFQVEINSDSGKYKLPGQDGNVFPKVPVIDQPNSMEIPAEVLLEAINNTSFATGDDEMRPVMSGVLFQMNLDNITFVATDAHRLVRYRRNDLRTPKSAALIVPKKPLGLLKSALAGMNSRVRIDFNDANAFFSFDHFNLVCRLIDGRYPNYDAVIPVDNPNKLTVAREPFLNSVRRVSLFSNKSANQVKLQITGSELAISAEDNEYNSEANERLTCEFSGQDMTIGFNAKFLAEMLNNMTCERVQLEMSLPNRAGLLSPASEEASADEDLLMLVMPVMVN